MERCEKAEGDMGKLAKTVRDLRDCSMWWTEAGGAESALVCFGLTAE